MNKIIKYSWIILVMASLVIVFLYFNNTLNKRMEPIEKSILDLADRVESIEHKLELFTWSQTCSVENIDWDIAVTALSQHFKDLAKDNPDVDFGPAEIERHFAENCEEDLKIYNEYISK